MTSGRRLDTPSAGRPKSFRACLEEAGVYPIPQVYLDTHYVSLFPIMWGLIWLGTSCLSVLSGAQDRWFTLVAWPDWVAAIQAGAMLAYLVGFNAGLCRGRIRLCFQGMGLFWSVAVIIQVLFFTLFTTVLGSYWLGESSFGVAGGFSLLAIGLIFYAGLVVVLFRRLAGIHRGRNKLCPNCGYDRQGDLFRTPCPECGYMLQTDERESRDAVECSV